MQNVSQEQGINALDFIGERATGMDFARMQELLQMNYGTKFPQQKMLMLFEMLAEEGWTKERLEKTVKWFLKTKKFATWTIADWFDYSVKLYPYSWYQKQIASGIKSEELQGYRVNGVVLWKLKDDIELPFEKV